jgi:hypothetical protein
MSDHSHASAAIAGQIAVHSPQAHLCVRSDVSFMFSPTQPLDYTTASSASDTADMDANDDATLTGWQEFMPLNGDSGNGGPTALTFSVEISALQSDPPRYSPDFSPDV